MKCVNIKRQKITRKIQKAKVKAGKEAIAKKAKVIKQQS